MILGMRKILCAFYQKRMDGLRLSKFLDNPRFAPKGAGNFCFQYMVNLCLDVERTVHIPIPFGANLGKNLLYSTQNTWLKNNLRFLARNEREHHLNLGFQQFVFWGAYNIKCHSVIKGVDLCSTTMFQGRAQHDDSGGGIVYL